MNKTRPDQWCKRITVVFIIAYVLMDLFPTHGAPYFRYTGSDPLYHVWNIGWPGALAIYDTRSGVHFGPFLYVVIPFQMVVVSLMGVVLWLLRNKRTA